MDVSQSYFPPFGKAASRILRKFNIARAIP